MLNYFQKFNHILCKIPSSLAGLALAIGSLAFCWGSVADLQGMGQSFGAIVAACIILPLFLKYLLNTRMLIQDLQHPISGSVIPTLPMATMVLSHNIALSYFNVAEVLSWLAILLHLFFFLYFIIYRSKNFALAQVLPSWFIPPIGLVLAIITHPGGLPTVLAKGLFILGLISYTLLLPIVIYRLIYATKLTNTEKPILIILATPASLLLLGYYIVVTTPSYTLVTLLLTLALVMTLYAYFALITLLRLPFVQTYSAFTFPLVVGAIALFKTNQFLFDNHFPVFWITIITHLAHIELMIASIMVCYVSLRYLMHYKNIVK